MLSHDSTILADVRSNMTFMKIAVVFELFVTDVYVLKVAALFE